jgi:hypothetical protein
MKSHSDVAFGMTHVDFAFPLHGDPSIRNMQVRAAMQCGTPDWRLPGSMKECGIATGFHCG